MARGHCEILKGSGRCGILVARQMWYAVRRTNGADVGTGLAVTQRRTRAILRGCMLRCIHAAELHSTPGGRITRQRGRYLIVQGCAKAAQTAPRHVRHRTCAATASNASSFFTSEVPQASQQWQLGGFVDRHLNCLAVWLGKEAACPRLRPVRPVGPRWTGVSPSDVSPRALLEPRLKRCDIFTTSSLLLH
jgi:hypothetical protein